MTEQQTPPNDSPAAGDMPGRHRFSGVARVLGTDGLARLRAAHVCVIGVGGVGSWAVEALARSGVGALTLIDWDDICITNVNRQIHALDGAYGQPKVNILAARIHAINPDAVCAAQREYLSEETQDEILAQPYDFVLDAIDSVNDKCRLIAACRRRKIRLLTVGGAGGRIDPTQIRVADLSRAINDPLLARVRKKLRQNYGFPRGRRRFRIECVYSPETIRYPSADGAVCSDRGAADGNMRLDCDSGYGALAGVTGTFGFVAAARIVCRLAGEC